MLTFCQTLVWPDRRTSWRRCWPCPSRGPVPRPRCGCEHREGFPWSFSSELFCQNRLVFFAHLMRAFSWLCFNLCQYCVKRSLKKNLTHLMVEMRESHSEALPPAPCQVTSDSLLWYIGKSSTTTSLKSKRGWTSWTNALQCWDLFTQDDRHILPPSSVR